MACTTFTHTLYAIHIGIDAIPIRLGQIAQREGTEGLEYINREVGIDMELWARILERAENSDDGDDDDEIRREDLPAMVDDSSYLDVLACATYGSYVDGYGRWDKNPKLELRDVMGEQSHVDEEILDAIAAAKLRGYFVLVDGSFPLERELFEHLQIAAFIDPLKISSVVYEEGKALLVVRAHSSWR